MAPLEVDGKRMFELADARVRRNEQAPVAMFVRVQGRQSVWKIDGEWLDKCLPVALLGASRQFMLTVCHTHCTSRGSPSHCFR